MAQPSATKSSSIIRQLLAMVRQTSRTASAPTADAAIGNDRQHRRKTGSPKIPSPDHCADHLTEAALEALNSIKRAGSAIGVSVVPSAKRVGQFGRSARLPLQAHRRADRFSSRAIIATAP